MPGKRSRIRCSCADASTNSWLAATSVTRQKALALIRGQVRHVDVFIASSEWYAGFMSRYLSIPRDRIRVVPLGINLEGHSPVAREEPMFRIGYLARIAPEKGLHVLAEAYRLLRRST